MLTVVSLVIIHIGCCFFSAYDYADGSDVGVSVRCSHDDASYDSDYDATGESWEWSSGDGTTDYYYWW